MTESPKEMIERLKLIVSGERDCDMSDNDMQALGWLIEAYLTPPQQQGWRSIESAPKDGTQLLLWITGIEPRPRIGFWSERGNDSGWYGLQTQHFIGVNVTHWMPLPSPPDPTKAD